MGVGVSRRISQTPRSDVLEHTKRASQSSWGSGDASTMDCLRFESLALFISSLWTFIQFHFMI